MKNSFIIAVILYLVVNIGYTQKRPSKKNIEKFTVSAFTREVGLSDSVEILVYMQIPNHTLQFVKSDSVFIAEYEAIIALQTKKGKQIGRQTWQDSIVVDDYIKTTSIVEKTILMTSFRAKPGKYRIFGSLLDLDTRNSGESKKKLELKDYTAKFYLHSPILLEKYKGDWGFGDSTIPAIRNSTFNVDEGLEFYISGRVEPREYLLKLKLDQKSGELLWQKTISDTIEKNCFEHTIIVPKEKLQGIGLKFTAELVQNGKTDEKSQDIAIRKPGISHLVSNINEALQQMRYILTSGERKQVKKASSKQKEELFKTLWKKRDPTPGTEANELMEEYFKRVAYANTHFDSYIDGWDTDMGMIYIIFGAPDDIERSIMQQQNNTYEIWYYYNIQETFTFYDENGFGHYRLTTPFLGYQR